MKKLIVISGLPCSGKSTIAEGISKKLKIPLFSVDPIESSIIRSGIKKSFETGLSAYLVVESLASEQLKSGLSVIIDAVSPIQKAREMWFNLSKKNKAKLIIIECVLDKDIHKKRVESRVRNLHGFPEITWNDVQKRKRQYANWNEKRLVLDTSSSKEKNLKRSLEYILKKR